jgi:hypothetical protein
MELKERTRSKCHDDHQLESARTDETAEEDRFTQRQREASFKPEIPPAMRNTEIEELAWSGFAVSDLL